MDFGVKSPGGSADEICAGEGLMCVGCIDWGCRRFQCHEDCGGSRAAQCRPCGATSVLGHWRFFQSISFAGEHSWLVGTTQTDSKSEGREWSSSVTHSISSGFELGGEIEGVGGKVTLTKEISTTIGTQVSSSFSHEFSIKQEETSKVVFTKEHVGKVVWLFHFDIADNCGHIENTVTHEFAVTPTAAVAPCCVPGYSTDIPAYTTCTSEDAMVPGGKDRGCKVADTRRGRMDGSPPSEQVV